MGLWRPRNYAQYDVLVVGGAPGGAFAAKTFAEKGYSVLLTEKRPAIGAPVRCAEGVGKALMHEFFKPEDRWVAAEIEKANIIAPDGFKMEVEPEKAGAEVGYVLQRKVFDPDLGDGNPAPKRDISVNPVC